MQIRILIAESEGIQKILLESEVIDDKIRRPCHDEDGEFFYDWVPAKEIRSFIAICQAELIANRRDDSTLNAYHMPGGGLTSVNRLAYAWSASIIEEPSGSKLYESALAHSESGISETRFDMYSYHVTEGGQHRYESYRLEYEAFEKLDLYAILGRYLDPASRRDSALGSIGI